MEIKIFRSNKGDCLLISNDFPVQRNRHILVDGGLTTSFREHVAPELHKILQRDEELDLLCVTHIDEDHIAGILEFMEQVIDWRVHRFFLQQNDNSRNNDEPDFDEPPPIGEVWHNAFSEIAGENLGPIIDALAHSAHVLSASVDNRLLAAADHATSVKQAIQLSQQLRVEQLGIRLNPRHKGRLVMHQTDQDTIKVGRFHITVIGPTAQALEELREKWNKWLDDNENTLANIQRTTQEIEARFQMDAIFATRPIPQLADELGDRRKVTAPNLASIMFLLEKGRTKVLMTGDGHGDDIVEGLRLTNKLDANEALHVDVLKVQHHGSEANLDLKFCQKITADHYIFCGNGAHHNPDKRVLEAIWASRMGPAEKLSQNAETDHPFKFWFSSSSEITSTSRKPHMREIEALTQQKSVESNGQFTFQFMGRDESFLRLQL